MGKTLEVEDSQGMVCGEYSFLSYKLYVLTCGVVIVKVEEAGTFNFPEFCYLMDRAVREDAEVGSGG